MVSPEQCVRAQGLGARGYGLGKGLTPHCVLRERWDLTHSLRLFHRESADTISRKNRPGYRPLLLRYSVCTVKKSPSHLRSSPPRFPDQPAP